MTLASEAAPQAARIADGDADVATTAAPPSGLYIHSPFCISICPYCDFVVYAGKAAKGPERRIERFTEALEVELGMRADALDARWGLWGLPTPGQSRTRPPLETLYIGGGTPSLLPERALARLIELVRERFRLADGAEVTLEANPGADERGVARGLHDAGVTRLSFGAQSFDPTELRTLGRRHSPGDVAIAVGQARAAGVQSINLDLLYDVPRQTLESWARTLDAALALQPDHISLYALTLDDPDTEGITGPTGDHLPLRRGARQWRVDARRRQAEDRAAAMYELADDRLGAAGYAWYEISNWSRPGHESRHNLGYWQGRAWEAVGPGAHAFDGERRRWNAASLDSYVRALQPADGAPPALPPGGADDTTSSPGERAMLALRTRAGLPADVLEGASLAGGLRWAMENGLLQLLDERLVLTLRGRLLSNEVFARLI